MGSKNHKKSSLCTCRHCLEKMMESYDLEKKDNIGGMPRKDFFIFKRKY